MPVTIYKRGKIFHYRGHAAGRRIRGTCRTADRKLAQEIAAEAERRAWRRLLDGPGADLTMAQAFHHYLDAGKPDRFLAPLADYWKDTPVADVTAGAIRQSAIKLYPEAKASTRNRQVIAPTQAAINLCAEMEWCKPIRVKRFKVETKPKAFVTPEWVAAFQAHASPHLGALARFMFETGARITESVNLTWADVDMTARTARFDRRKGGHGRIARLTPAIVAALANIPTNRNPAERVFLYTARTSVRQPWNAVIARAGIEMRSPHCCRHGFATAMLRAKVDVKTVARWGGWSDVRVLLDTYAHAIEDPGVVDGVFDTPVTQSADARHISNSNVRRKSP